MFILYCIASQVLYILNNKSVKCLNAVSDTRDSVSLATRQLDRSLTEFTSPKEGFKIPRVRERQGGAKNRMKYKVTMSRHSSLMVFCIVY